MLVTLQKSKAIPFSLQLFGSIVIITVLVMVFFAFLVYNLSSELFIRNYATELEKNFKNFFDLNNQRHGIVQGPRAMSGGPQSRISKNLFIMINGEVLQNPDGIPVPEFFEGRKLLNIDGNTYLFYGFTDSGKRIFLGIRTAEYDFLLGGLRKAFVIAILLSVLLSGIVGYYISSKISKPLKRTMELLREVVVSDLSKRVSINSNTKEILELTRAVNSALDRIEDSYKRQEQFASDVAHEIRSPLTAILGFSRIIQRWGAKDPEVVEESAKSIAETTEKMLTLTEGLLFLSKPDLSPNFEILELKVLIENVISDISRIYEIKIKNTVPDLKVKTDENLLSIAMKILLENAAKHGEGKPVEIGWDEKRKALYVKDHGPGIPDEIKDKIFDRFFKAESSRSGSGHGLGLSILKKICDTLGLNVKVEDPPDGGTSFVITGWQLLR